MPAPSPAAASRGIMSLPSDSPRGPSVLTLLRNADLYAPEPLGVRDVLVAGPTVAWVGARVDLPAALAADVVDLDGRRVIPGLIDPHVHVTGGGGEAGAATKVPPVPLTQLTLGGITT